MGGALHAFPGLLGFTPGATGFAVLGDDKGGRGYTTFDATTGSFRPLRSSRFLGVDPTHMAVYGRDGVLLAGGADGPGDPHSPLNAEIPLDVAVTRGTVAGALRTSCSRTVSSPTSGATFSRSSRRPSRCSRPTPPAMPRRSSTFRCAVTSAWWASGLGCSSATAGSPHFGVSPTSAGGPSAATRRRSRSTASVTCSSPGTIATACVRWWSAPGTCRRAAAPRPRKLDVAGRQQDGRVHGRRPPYARRVARAAHRRARLRRRAGHRRLRLRPGAHRAR